MSYKSLFNRIAEQNKKDGRSAVLPHHTMAPHNTGQSPLLGACCRPADPPGTGSDVPYCGDHYTQDSCIGVGGTFVGTGTWCKDVVCATGGTPLGRCCHNSGPNNPWGCASATKETCKAWNAQPNVTAAWSPWNPNECESPCSCSGTNPCQPVPPSITNRQPRR